MRSLDLAKPIPWGNDIQLRNVLESDVDGLAELMLDAYMGTIDYEGETLSDSKREMANFFKGEVAGPFILRCSPIACQDSRILTACLISQWSERSYPWIAFVMTAKKTKNRGFGRKIVLEGLRMLQHQGYPAVGAMITEGNIASERLFTSLGFKRI